MKSHGTSRRDFVAGAGALLAGTALFGGCEENQASTPKAGPPAPPAGTPAPAPRPERPRNIILMISDGMSLGVPSLAEPFSHLVRGRGTAWQQLLRDPEAIHGLLSTHSANSLVTDSAAAACAMASGEKIRNGQLNIRPDGGEIEPLAERLRPSGHRVGLVTSDEMCGATPAGFAAICPSRNRYNDIAPQYLDRVDVLLGGGRDNFDPLARSDGRDLFNEYAQKDYRLVLSRDDVLAHAGGGRMLGLFGRGKLPYTIDHRQEAELRQVPTLAEMSRCALNALAAAKDPFFAMIEGARIDHAAHKNDAAALFWDQLAFDDAVALALAFARERGDTLVVITSDHGNSNPGLNGMGGSYGSTDQCFKRLGKATCSFDRLHGEIAQAVGQGELAVKDLVHKRMGVELSAAQVKEVIATFDKAIDDPHEVSDSQRNWYGLLSQILGNHTGIGFTSHQHTQDHVLCSAVGPGARHFAGLHHHTELAELMQGMLMEKAAAEAVKD